MSATPTAIRGDVFDDYMERAEATRLADVYARDAEHVETFKTMAANIQHGLGHVAAFEHVYKARALAHDLQIVLRELEAQFRIESDGARKRSARS